MSSLSLRTGPCHSVRVGGLSVRWGLAACVRREAGLLKNPESVACWPAGLCRILQGLCKGDGTESVDSLHRPGLGVGLRFEKGGLQSMSLRELIIDSVGPSCQLCSALIALTCWSISSYLLRVALLIFKDLLSWHILYSGIRHAWLHLEESAHFPRQGPRVHRSIILLWKEIQLLFSTALSQAPVIPVERSLR